MQFHITIIIYLYEYKERFLLGTVKQTNGIFGMHVSGSLTVVRTVQPSTMWTALFVKILLILRKLHCFYGTVLTFWSNPCQPNWNHFKTIQDIINLNLTTITLSLWVFDIKDCNVQGLFFFQPSIGYKIES